MANEIKGTPSIVFGISGPKGDKGEKGDKGDAFRFEDFTPEELEALKGEKGDKGDKGDKGEDAEPYDDTLIKNRLDDVGRQITNVENKYVEKVIVEASGISNPTYTRDGVSLTFAQVKTLMENTKEPKEFYINYGMRTYGNFFAYADLGTNYDEGIEGYCIEANTRYTAKFSKFNKISIVSAKLAYKTDIDSVKAYVDEKIGEVENGTY